MYTDQWSLRVFTLTALALELLFAVAAVLLLYAMSIVGGLVLVVALCVAVAVRLPHAYGCLRDARRLSVAWNRRHTSTPLLLLLLYATVLSAALTARSGAHVNVWTRVMRDALRGGDTDTGAAPPLCVLLMSVLMCFLAALHLASARAHYRAASPVDADTDALAAPPYEQRTYTDEELEMEQMCQAGASGYDTDSASICTEAAGARRRHVDS